MIALNRISKNIWPGWCSNQWSDWRECRHTVGCSFHWTTPEIIISLSVQSYFIWPPGLSSAWSPPRRTPPGRRQGWPPQSQPGGARCRPRRPWCSRRTRSPGCTAGCPWGSRSGPWGRWPSPSVSCSSVSPPGVWSSGTGSPGSPHGSRQSSHWQRTCQEPRSRWCNRQRQQAW